MKVLEVKFDQAPINGKITVMIPPVPNYEEGVHLSKKDKKQQQEDQQRIKPFLVVEICPTLLKLEGDNKLQFGVGDMVYLPNGLAQLISNFEVPHLNAVVASPYEVIAISKPEERERFLKEYQETIDTYLPKPVDISNVNVN